MSRSSDGAPPYVYIGGKGWVYALDQLTGDVAWELELKPGWFKLGSSFVTLQEGADALYAFAYGNAYRLEKWSGEVQWMTPLSQLKHHPVCLSTDATCLTSVSGTAAVTAAMEQRRRAEAAQQHAAQQHATHQGMAGM